MEATHNLVLILHVLGAAIIIGISFVTLVIEAKNWLEGPILKLTELLWKIAGPLLGIQLLTGGYLFMIERDKFSGNPYLGWKLLLFFVGGGLVGVINRRRFAAIKEGKKLDSGVRFALIGFLLFVLIAALGVLLAESHAE